MVGIYGKRWKLGRCSANFIFLCIVLKENFMVVIRELEMAWIKNRKKLIRKKSGN